MFRYSFISEKGSRDLNEDSVGYVDNKNDAIFIVADGLGGYDRGEIASSHVVSEAKNYFGSNKMNEESLVRMFKSLQSSLISEQNAKNSGGMKTTLSVLCISEKKIYRAYVGDSRIYRFLKRGAFEHTVDHSVPQMLAKSGQIKESEIRFHPDRNKLLRALGDEKFDGIPEIVKPVKYKRGEAYLLCSDGFWELIDENQMMTCLSASITPEEWIKLMVSIIIANGGGGNMDNYSAIGVFL